MPDGDPAALRGTAVRSWMLVAGIYAVLVVYLLVHDLGATAYDDSYFFKRFATNALQHGVFAWNVADGPVHGSTSQLYQLLTTLVTAVARDHFVVAVRVLNAGALIGLGALAIRWCGRATEDPLGGQLIALLTLSGPLVLTTLITGMETAVTLALLMAVLARLFSPSGPRGRAVPDWQAAGLTALLYTCRPDAAVIPAVALGLDRLFRRRPPIRYALILAAMMLVLWGGLWAYYGTPLPLSFYMKTSGLENYDAHVLDLGLQVKKLHFGATIAFAAPLLFLALRPRALKPPGPTLALVVSVLALWGYHLLLTNEIMGYRGRFYAPGLVALALAAARSWDVFRADARWWPAAAMVGVWAVVVAWAYRAAVIPTHEGFFISQIPWPAYAGVIVAAAGLLFVPMRWPAWVRTAAVAVPLTAGLLGWKPPRAPTLQDDAKILRRHAAEVTTVRGIFDVARCLPDAKNVYHSEMGVTGLVLIGTRTVDLAGILSPEAGVAREPFDDYCQRDQPEAIFVPHRNYKTLNAEIRASSCFSNYRRVVDQSSSPLHVRKDLAKSFLRCAEDVHRWRKPKKRKKGKRRRKRRR